MYFDRCKGGCYSQVHKNATVDNLVHIIFDGQVDSFTKATLQKDETKVAIKEAVIAVVGEEVSVKYDNLK